MCPACIDPGYTLGLSLLLCVFYLYDAICKACIVPVLTMTLQSTKPCVCAFLCASLASGFDGEPCVVQVCSCSACTTLRVATSDPDYANIQTAASSTVRPPASNVLLPWLCFARCALHARLCMLCCLLCTAVHAVLCCAGSMPYAHLITHICKPHVSSGIAMQVRACQCHINTTSTVSWYTSCCPARTP